MSVYLKLQKVRNELSKSELKKTGENKHSKFKYFELGDFLPKISELCDKHGICTIIKFGEKVATLKVVDVEKVESNVTFTTPIAHAKLPGSPQPVQNLGATQTYMRRYLYMNAFEISEFDAVDSSDNETKKTESKQEIKVELASSKVKALYTIATKSGYDTDAIHDIIKKKYKVESTKHLTVAQFTEMCKGMEKNPKIKEVDKQEGAGEVDSSGNPQK